MRLKAFLSAQKYENLIRLGFQNATALSVNSLTGCHSLNSNAVWDLVGGHVVVRQLLSLVPPLDGAGYLCQLLPELLHGFLHWLLYEVLIRIHAQVQLQAERRPVIQPGGTPPHRDKDHVDMRKIVGKLEVLVIQTTPFVHKCVWGSEHVCKYANDVWSQYPLHTSFSWYWLRAQTAPRCQLERPRSGRLSTIKFTSARPFWSGGGFRMVDGALGIQEHQSYYTTHNN